MPGRNAMTCLVILAALGDPGAAACTRLGGP
jgi:hypothetical protein